MIILFRKRFSILCKLMVVACCFSTAAMAKMDLVTVPTRDSVQVTIYNSADLTLVREIRMLTITKGINKLQFSWANTLIDPTSLEMKPLKDGDKIDVDALIFPPRVKDLGLWTVHSEVSGDVPFEITYFTSGINWRAFYMGTLSQDEKTMRLQGYVRVANNSGEEYANAQTRLIVGKINLLDQIAALARRQSAYGRPEGPVPPSSDMMYADKVARQSDYRKAKSAVRERLGNSLARVKEVKKEGLSEYFLYTIEGEETIPNQWQKRLPSFDTKEIPVVNLYKYEQERYGNACVRFLSFKNDKKHKLGETPIPGGSLKVYRNADEALHLSYEGTSSFKYIPVEEDIELNLGGVSDVIVEPKLMEVKSQNFTFSKQGNIDGWDDLQTVSVKVKNTRDVAIKIAITRNFSHQYWELERKGDAGKYEKVDMDTVKFTLELPARSTKEFSYTLRKFEGKRRERR